MTQVRNKVLSLTRNVIPYVKELRKYTDSVVGCILMQQLDYWFARYPEGFYKFLEPSDHTKYVPGQSWQEELGISLTEFRTAFDRIGIRWKSKTEFEGAQDKFQGKFYASYQDKRSNLTYYLRNHDLVDTALGELVCDVKLNTASINGGNARVPFRDPLEGMQSIPSSPGDEESSSPGTKETQSTVNEGLTSLGIRNVHLQEMRKPEFNNTETTNTEITQKLLLQPATKAVETNECLIFPTGMFQEEVVALGKIVAELDSKTAQQVLDEIGGLRKAGKVRKSCIGLAAELVRRCSLGEFIPSAGFSIAAERAQTPKLVRPSIRKPTNSDQKISLKERLEKSGVTLGNTRT